MSYGRNQGALRALVNRSNPALSRRARWPWSVHKVSLDTAPVLLRAGEMVERWGWTEGFFRNSATWREIRAAAWRLTKRQGETDELAGALDALRQHVRLRGP